MCIDMCPLPNRILRRLHVRTRARTHAHTHTRTLNVSHRPGSKVVLLDSCNTTACTNYSIASLAPIEQGECEVTVAVIGLTSDARSKLENGDACGCPDGDAVEGECCDRKDVKLPGKQLDLLQSITSAHKRSKVGRVVVVTINAGMLDLSWPQQSDSVGAIVLGMYLGMTSGQAIADTLLGNNNPAGRLPITYYQNISQIGGLSNDYGILPTKHRHGRTYRYFSGPVLYPFGYGLSFTRFEYSGAMISPNIANPCNTVSVTATVSNVGDYDGDEVVQL